MIVKSHIGGFKKSIGPYNDKLITHVPKILDFWIGSVVGCRIRGTHGQVEFGLGCYS